jgi:hypothetical protein
MSVGTWVFIAWTIVIGFVGLVLLSGLAYALHFSNLALAIICAVLASSTVLLFAGRTPLMGAPLVEGNADRRASLAAESSLT